MPQATHRPGPPPPPPLQTVPGAEHHMPAPVSQQSCPRPPQVPHEPPEHIPVPPPQVLPTAMQVLPPLQQLPLAQVLASQHGVPGVPHTAQMPAPPVQTKPLSHRRTPPEPGQQASPPPPHDEHAPAVQVPSEPPQVVPAGTQVPLTQQPAAPQVSPAQQGCPLPPQATQAEVPPAPVRHTRLPPQLAPGQQG